MANGISLYSDMDGVLSDFDRQFRAASGAGPDEFMSRERRTLERDGATEDEAYDEARTRFWRVVSGVANFWTAMPQMPEMERYWNGIAAMAPTILTAAPEGPEGERAEAGKREWVARTLGAHVPVVVLRLMKNHNVPVKDAYAKGPKSILIDDNYNYVKSWQRSGGNAVLFKSAGQALSDLSRLVPWLSHDIYARMIGAARRGG